MFEWTLMKRLIWIKAAVISGAASLYETVTGAIVSFIALHAKALKKLVVNIEPVQDLHGYDAPWPPGANPYNQVFKILEHANVEGDGSINPNGTNNVGCAKIEQGKTYIVRNSANGSGALVCAFYTDEPDYNSVSYDGSRIVGGPNPFTAPITGYIAFRTAADFFQLQLEEGSTLHDYAPYENNCPISGWTGVDVNVAGHNVWDEECDLGLLNPDGSITPSASRLVSSFISVVPGETYAYCWPSSLGRGRGAFFDANKNLIQYEADFPPSTSIPDVSVFTVPDGAHYLIFNLTTAYGMTYNHDVSINYPSTDTEYHAYNGTTRQIVWQDEAGTVYGATVTVKQDGSVDMAVNRASVLLSVFDFSELSTPENHIFRAKYSEVLPNIAPHTDGSQTYGDICSLFGYKAYGPISGADNGKFAIAPISNGRIIFIDHRFSDVQDFEDAVQNVRLCCYLAEPVTYHLDSITQLSTVVGQNNIWADAGDVEVTYYAK